MTNLSTIATTKSKQKDSNTTIKTQKILESEQEPQPSTLTVTKNSTTTTLPNISTLEDTLINARRNGLNLGEGFGKFDIDLDIINFK